MIDSTVVQMGQVDIGLGTYIGPFCVLGFPDLGDSDYPSKIVYDKNKYPLSRGLKIGANSMLLSHVVIGEGSVLGADVWCDHHTQIGCDTNIADGVQIMYGAKIYDRVRVGERAWIGGFLCNDAVVEANAVVLGMLIHKFTNSVEGVPEMAPIVHEGGFIGMNAVIIGAIEVGKGAYIAAGAVLTRSAREGRLYKGVPARDVGPALQPFSFRKT